MQKVFHLEHLLVKRILRNCNANSYTSNVTNHGSEEEPSNAIEHIFLVKYILNDEGKLEQEDLDRLTISKKELTL